MQGQTLAEWPQFPFCSPRCKLIDLGRWLDGSYRIPAEETEEPLLPEDEDTP
jgi:endogenous inhibitor of DNA gyrase (YacG/DUF329 family)